MESSKPEWKTLIGDKAAFDTEILRTLVGSQVHGLNLAGTDDRDEMGIYIPSPETMLGVGAPKGGLLARTAENNQRSYHGDTDLMLYSLRKYVSLATSGNPSILIPLFAPPASLLFMDSYGSWIRAERDLFVTRYAGYKFRGYAHAQRERLTGGGKRNRVPNRPELVEKYGYDTKYAMHALRLTMQGLEFLTEGALTLPMKDGLARRCMRVRQGEVDFQTALGWIDVLLAELDNVLDTKKLDIPERPDYPAISKLLVDMHQEYWAAS